MSGRMVRVAGAVLLPYAVLGLAGCGAAGAGSPTAAAPGATTAATTAATGATTTGATWTAYPIVVTRIGGIAGFSDTMTVTADRRVRLVGKLGGSRTCLLTESAWAGIGAAMSGLVWTPEPTVAPYPDYLGVDVRAPGHGPGTLPGDHPLATLLVALASGEPTPGCTAEPGGAT